jgi:hypothetical protein
MDKNDLYFLERAETKLKNDNVFQACLPLDRKNPVWADLSQLLLINEKLVLQKHLEAQGVSRQVLALLCPALPLLLFHFCLCLTVYPIDHGICQLS